MFGHLPYSPHEWALRARAHPDAARFLDASRVLSVAAHTPGSPFPAISRREAAFYFVGINDAEEVRTEVKDTETILSCALHLTFETRWTQAGSSRHRIRTAELPSGMKVELVALAEHFDGLGEREDTGKLVAA